MRNLKVSVYNYNLYYTVVVKIYLLSEFNIQNLNKFY